MDLFGKGRYIFKGSREAHGCVNCILLNGGPQCKKQINNCKHLIIPWLLIPVPPNIATPPPVWKMWRTNASGSKNLSGTRACSSSVSNVGLVKLSFYSRRQLFIKCFLSRGWFLSSVEQQREIEVLVLSGTFGKGSRDVLAVVLFGVAVCSDVLLLTLP